MKLSLDHWAVLYQTDKGSQAHAYTQWYERHLAHFVGEPVTLLEIGIGHEANSLKMWRDWLGPAARVIGVDKNPEFSAHANGLGFITECGDAGNAQFISDVIERHQPDVVIDDGSHFANEQQVAFENAFPRLRDGAIYVIEDLHAAYWGWGGRFMSYLHVLIDKLNKSGRITDPTFADYLERTVRAMHFYPSLVFIEKADKTR